MQDADRQGELCGGAQPESGCRVHPLREEHRLPHPQSHPGTSECGCFVCDAWLCFEDIPCHYLFGCKEGHVFTPRIGSGRGSPQSHRVHPHRAKHRLPHVQSHPGTVIGMSLKLFHLCAETGTQKFSISLCVSDRCGDHCPGTAAHQ